MKKNLWLLSMIMTPLTGMACAGDDQAVAKTLKKLAMPQAEIQPSPVTGLNTVMTENGVRYITSDGKYMLGGPLFDLSGSEPVNVTNELLNKKLQAMSSEMIIYKAPQEKYIITVFTDISCGYCQKLHNDMQGYNARGITVRYLAYPRQGLTSDAAKNMSAVWCATDRKKSLDMAMKNEKIPASAACETDIGKHFQLGSSFGVQGTPAVVLENGTVIPGYQNPEDMVSTLNTYKAPLKTAG